MGFSVAIEKSFSLRFFIHCPKHKNSMVTLKIITGHDMSKIGLIPLKEAAEAIGININIMHGRSAPKQIKKYIYNKGTPNQLFDVNGYKKEKDEEKEVIEKTTLFIEYLCHIEDIDYIQMQRITKIKKTYITTLNFTFRASIKFIKKMCEYDSQLITNFGDYYDFGSRFENTVEKHCTDRKDI